MCVCVARNGAEACVVLSGDFRVEARTRGPVNRAVLSVWLLTEFTE